VPGAAWRLDDHAGEEGGDFVAGQRDQPVWVRVPPAFGCGGDGQALTGLDILLDSPAAAGDGHNVGPSTLVHTLVTDTTAPADEVAALEGTGTVVKTA
jgi:hypothetical protein